MLIRWRPGWAVPSSLHAIRYCAFVALGHRTIWSTTGAALDVTTCAVRPFVNVTSDVGSASACVCVTEAVDDEARPPRTPKRAWACASRS
jgi:hypothetical protein